MATMIKRFFQLTKSYYDVVSGKVDINAELKQDMNAWYNVTPNEHTTNMGSSTTTLGHKKN